MLFFLYHPVAFILKGKREYYSFTTLCIIEIYCENQNVSSKNKLPRFVVELTVLFRIFSNKLTKVKEIVTRVKLKCLLLPLMSKRMKRRSLLQKL